MPSQLSLPGSPADYLKLTCQIKWPLAISHVQENMSRESLEQIIKPRKKYLCVCVCVFIDTGFNPASYE